MGTKYVMGVDLGTSGVKAVIFDHQGKPVTSGYMEIPVIYPKPGWVEQDPNTLWQKTIGTIREALTSGKISASELDAIGIANQGETIIMWDRHTGQPIYNAIVWQCRRTAEMCKELKAKGLEELIKQRTGLVLDPYFSATKIKWLLENIRNAREKAEQGEILCGTTDTWLIWKLTGGRSFSTDYATASRTMLLNIHELKWDKEILRLLDIPESILPKPYPNAQILGYTDPRIFYGEEIPIGSSIVDQQGALFGQACYKSCMVKATYGTGCFILMNIGQKPLYSRHGLLTTIAWVIDGKATYAFDGGTYIAGAALQWLRDSLKMIKDFQEAEVIATSIEDTGGVYFVPAFVGLAAPYWDTYARGTIIGITGGTSREHIVRAALESIAYQVYEILDSMRADSNCHIEKIRVDGGMTKNNFLMQFQSDILGIPIEVPKITETTSLGAAFLAGLATGFWNDIEELSRIWKIDKTYYPSMTTQKREQLLKGWKKAVQRSLMWAIE